MSSNGVEQRTWVFALVRHAHAGQKKLWQGPDDQRPLNGRGRQQAEGVAENLHPMPVTRLVSSPYLRCLQTLGPLSARLGTPITSSRLLCPDTNPRDLDGMLAQPVMDGAVLCTHGETLVRLFDHWRRRRRLSVSPGGPPDRTTPKGGAWIVEAQGRHRTAHYLRPLHVGAALPADDASWT